MNNDKDKFVTVNISSLKELIDEDAERYNNQYNRLLKQNRSLQKEVKDLKSQLEQYTKIQIESDYCELSKNCKLLQKYVTENDNLRKIMWESRCPHVVMGECSREHHDNCVGMAKCIEDLQAENEIQKKELCQRYEEPEFATFLLMGKTAKEWQNIQAENEELKNDILNGVMCITCPDKNENCRLQAENERLKAENKELSESIKRLKNMAKAAALGREKYKYALQELEKENERLKARLRPLEDSYFNGLSSIQITELAKKSIRITAENRKLEYALQEIREYCEEQNLKADYTACEVIRRIEEVIGAEK